MKPIVAQIVLLACDIDDARELGGRLTFDVALERAAGLVVMLENELERRRFLRRAQRLTAAPRATTS